MINLQGQRFGRLVAIRPTEKRYHNSVVWECRCDCGNTKDVPASMLKSGSTKSCGCLQTGGSQLDLQGQRFGKLVAIRPTEKRYRNSVVWECQCDCGNTKDVPASSLKNGSTKSCGCLQTGGGPLDLQGQRFGKLVAIRPTEKRYQNSVIWECRCDCGNTKDVPASFLRTGGTKSCGCLHRGKIGKHSGETSTDNPAGVVWHERKKKWQAKVRIEGKVYTVGYFSAVDDAKAARAEAVKEIYDALEKLKNR